MLKSESPSTVPNILPPTNHISYLRTRKTELEILSSSGSGSGQDDLAEFYVRLGKIKDHHAKYPDQPISNFDLEFAHILTEPGADEYEEEVEEEDRESISTQYWSVLRG